MPTSLPATTAAAGISSGVEATLSQSSGHYHCVGAPLPHAAIVARELGIPAVVGCGNATTRLKTGDRVIVDGRQGRVEVVKESQD